MPRKANNELRKTDLVLLDKLPDSKRQQIRNALLGEESSTNDGITTYTKIAYSLSVPISAVRAVARSMKNELTSDELGRKDELRRAILSGAIAATDQLLEALSAGEIRPGQLPTVVGILVDKYNSLRDENMSTGLVAAVALTGDKASITSQLLRVLQGADDRARAIDVEAVDVEAEPPD